MSEEDEPKVSYLGRKWKLCPNCNIEFMPQKDEEFCYICTSTTGCPDC